MKILRHLWVQTKAEAERRRSDRGHIWKWNFKGKIIKKMSNNFVPESDDWDNTFSEIGLDFLRWWNRRVEEKSIGDKGQSLWTIYVECSPHCHHKALGQLMIWIAFQLCSLWIGYSKKNAFIYWHNFGNRLVIDS